jgi:flagellar hook protein FlgE
MSFQSLFIGKTGLQTHSEGLNVIGNNISNVNTLGFKSQDIHFQNLFSEAVVGTRANGQEDVRTGAGTSQLGMGVGVAQVRTNFEQGAFEPTNEATDLAIAGKGFFRTVDEEGGNYYTRAGNFRFDNQAVLRSPQGFALQGFAIEDGDVAGALSPVSLPVNDDGSISQDPEATDRVRIINNLGAPDPEIQDPVSDETDPFFSMIQRWDANAEPPLANADHVTGFTFYDAQGQGHSASIHFEKAAINTDDAKNRWEFVVALDNPGEDASAAAGTPGAGLLMSGVLTFDAAGELESMSAFTPTGGEHTNLDNWTLAPLSGEGLPQFQASFEDADGNALSQAVSLDLGLAAQGGWDAPQGQTAAAIGQDFAALPAFTDSSITEDFATTAFDGGAGSTLLTTEVDGFPRGFLQNIHIDDEGVLTGQFSNGQTEDLYQIPIFNFTNEFGLRREGGNNFTATLESGEPTTLAAGPESTGFIASQSLEQSNVDLAREFVSMISTQRGFQANGKVITTSDYLINNALQMKR